MNDGDVRKGLLKFSSEDRAKKNAYFFKTQELAQRQQKKKNQKAT